MIFTMALNTDFNLLALRDANREIHKLEEAAIERARLYLAHTGKNVETFINTNGYSVRVNRDTLLEDSFVDVAFYQRDEQGGGSTQTIQIPRSVILGDLTKEEQEFAEYKRLQAKFEKK
jgi:hypothetical protein